MTERLSGLSQQIRGVQQLDSVVIAMRAIAATRAQQGRGLLAGVRAYAQVVAQAITQALALAPRQTAGARHRRTERSGLVLFCAELGFAGALSDRILDTVAPELGGADLFVVGTRGAIAAEQRRLPLAWSTGMALHAEAVPAVAQRIAEALYQSLQGGGVTNIAVVFPTWSADGGVAVIRRSLLPMELPPVAAVPAQGPLTTIRPAVLLELLADEYLLAQLCEAAMEGFLAENEARAVTMTEAHGSIGRMLSTLQARERQVRQEEITAELLELAGGAGQLGAAGEASVATIR